MKLGIYSGTFDPIHEGHILFVQLALDQFGLDEVVLVPERQPRHKSPQASFGDRLEMIRLATSSDSRIHVFDHDKEPQHTIRGVFSAIALDYPDDDYVLLMGSDVFAHIGAWGNGTSDDGSIHDVREHIGIVVGIKNMSEIETLETLSKELELNTQFIEQPLYGLSSTRVRERIKQGEEPRGVQDEVAEYIKTHMLYA